MRGESITSFLKRISEEITGKKSFLVDRFILSSYPHLALQNIRLGREIAEFIKWIRNNWGKDRKENLLMNRFP